ncbi:hydroxymethylglutaryl-CoA synthase [Candidatus Profftella armatura]
MIKVGIEAINLYGGSVFIDVIELAKYRKLDTVRFENLLMQQKSVSLPYEDPVSFAINAAAPLIDNLSNIDKNSIELIITCSESGIDFGKSMSTYIHHYLGLNRNCRLFELKQACYSCTAGLQMAINFILSKVSPGAKALVIATDISRFFVTEDKNELTMEWAFFEPSGGAGAVAMLISDKPEIFQFDIGSNGYYSFEVMDTCRPIPDSEAGNADLSLLSYLDCCAQSFKEYKKRVPNVNYKTSFDYLSFHTPFGGMVNGAHRYMMRQHSSNIDKIDIEKDFQKRVKLGLIFCQKVGNIMGGTIMVSLISIIENGDFNFPKRIGLFSYGSGCSSEFYSGVATSISQKKIKLLNIKKYLDSRYQLNINEYEVLIKDKNGVKFGTRDAVLDTNILPNIWKFIKKSLKKNNQKRIFLVEIKGFYRRYKWFN